MIPFSFSRKLSFALLSFWFAAVSAQARLGSEKNEEVRRPDTVTHILSVLESLIRAKTPSPPTFETELVVMPQYNPVDRKVLHARILATIRGTLTRGVIIGDGAGGKDSEQVFMLYVPRNAMDLELTTRGGSGDVALYAMRGNIPTPSRYECRSTGHGTRQSCVIPKPEQGTYYVLLRGNASYSGVSVTGAFDLAKTHSHRPELSSTIGAAEATPRAPNI
jgi:hypothetical protein